MKLRNGHYYVEISVDLNTTQKEKADALVHILRNQIEKTTLLNGQRANFKVELHDVWEYDERDAEQAWDVPYPLASG